jgi:hypothetical protein
METDVIEILEPSYFDHPLNKKLLDMIIVIRHNKEGEQ